jgi:bile acid:Na+ symporter, BASS family
VEQTILSKVVLPLALFIIMLGMGLSLVSDDFKRVVKFPKAIAIGVACQMLLLPLVGLGIVTLIPMDSPELAVGLVILALCPGGTTSNLMTYLARGDVALSITLTAVVSIVTPFTIPIFADLAMNHLMGAGQAIQLPLGKTIIVLLAITVVPVGIGMGIRKKWPTFAQKADKPVKILSIVFLIAIIAAIVKQNIDELPSFFAQTGTAALLLNISTIILGFTIAKFAGLSRSQQTTIGMEVGIQNGTTALLVTGTLLANSTMTIAPAIYSLLMFATGGVFGYLANLGRDVAAEESAEDLEET